MATWKTPVTWTVGGTVTITADTLEEAMKIAKDENEEIPLPDDGEYVSSSWSVDEDIDMVRSYYNANRPDE